MNNSLTGDDEEEGDKTQYSGRKHMMHEEDTEK